MMDLNKLAMKYRSKFYEGTSGKDWQGNFPCVGEIKYDGEYVIVICTTSGVIIANKHKSQYKPTAEMLKTLPKADVIFEAEQISLKGDLYEYFKVRGTSSPDLALRIFGLLHYNGRDTSGMTYPERRQIMEKLLGGQGNVHVHLCEARLIRTPKDIDVNFKSAVDEGHEGIVIKSSGPRSTCMKLKKSQTKDLAVLGIEKTESWLSAGQPECFIIGCQTISGEWKTLGKASSGLTKEEKRQLGFKVIANKIGEDKNKILCNPTEVLEILFQEKTAEGFRVPRIMRWRQDKSVEMIDTILEDNI